MRKILLVVFLLVLLFLFSGQSYDQQSIVPFLERLIPNMPFESLLSRVEVPYYGNTVSIEEWGYFHFIEFLIRKTVHFFFYAILASVIYITLPKLKYRITIAAFITLLVAITDEFHQSFTSGRTQSFQDVILDMAGALTALTLLKFFLKQRESEIEKIH